MGIDGEVANAKLALILTCKPRIGHSKGRVKPRRYTSPLGAFHFYAQKGLGRSVLASSTASDTSLIRLLTSRPRARSRLAVALRLWTFFQ